MTKKDIIDGAIVRNGLNREKTALLMGISSVTLSRRIKNPDRFTIAELRQLNNVVHFTEKERDMLLWKIKTERG